MFNRPLKFNTNDEQVDAAVNKAVVNHLGEAAGQFAVLDKLNMMSELFMFAMIPNARTVAVVPAMEVFPSTNVWRVLRPRDYTMLRGPVSFANLLAGVVIRGDLTDSVTSLGAIAGNTAGVDRLAGVFIGSNNGQLQVIESPEWLRTKVFGPSAVGTKTVYDKNYGLTQTQTLSEYEVAGCNYAQTYWAKNNFGTRSIAIATPLRFDIGPGSNIMIDGINLSFDRSITQADSLSKLYGYVQAVTISVDAQSSSASTTLELSHVRTKAEEDLVPDKHPMYNIADGEAWTGHPLVRLTDDDMIPQGE